MTKEEVIRAWKDPEYRVTLDQAPEHPAGIIELTDDDLRYVVSGALNSGVRNVRWPNRPPTPATPRWRTYRPRNSVKPRR